MATPHLERLFEHLTARLDALEHENRGLREDGARLREDVAGVKHQNAQLQTTLAQWEQRQPVPATAPPAAETRVSRRGMLTGALGAAAATLGAGAVLEGTTSPAAVGQRHPHHHGPGEYGGGQHGGALRWCQ